MANWMKLIGQTFLTVLCLYFIALENEVEARGGRGGRGGRFGGRSRSYRSGYRSGIRSGLRMSSTKTAIIAGTVFGAAAYRRRRRFNSYPDSDPEICHNSQYVGNGTIYYYGKFICPMENQPDDYSYCCGPEGRQTCCRFFDDAGRTAGVVIGVILAAIVIGAVIFFCVCKQKMNKSPGQVISTFRNRSHKHDPGRGMYSSAATENVKVGYAASPPAPTMTYPVQPANGGVMQPPPPSYDAVAESDKQNLPYGMNPEPGYNKQPLPNGDYSNAGETPYPMNPVPPTAPYPGAPGPDAGYMAQPYPPPPADQNSGYPPQPYPNAYQPYPPQ
ncbi:hypothetical protein KUTeg_001913 [Tegillarca granosa]|uniref:Uncharacterized protein n=1 Tax=Tegillarca granosa TaxID=220873 RepID=A0ABQ9FU96_TEGGR|nr:hypothetical protein KUTeg_001913 [Tegillarca granosa]